MLLGDWFVIIHLLPSSKINYYLNYSILSRKLSYSQCFGKVLVRNSLLVIKKNYLAGFMARLGSQSSPPAAARRKYCNFIAFENWDMYGSDIANIRNKSFRDCARACETEENGQCAGLLHFRFISCTFFKYQQLSISTKCSFYLGFVSLQNDNCWLKKSANVAKLSESIHLSAICVEGAP